jgi:hypothetical protein
MRFFVTLTALACAAVVATSPASAIVPPKSCGSIKVGHHRYNIKADQLPCSKARTYASRYISTGRRPRGYSCRKYKGSALYARCVNTRANPDRTIFIIKR